MTPAIQHRIEQIQRGEVPEGYKKTMCGIIPSEWSTCSIGDCLERVVHPVQVQRDMMYTQIGLRSHGKGLFYKEAVTGESLGDKAVFWVEPDCFVLNIVFAWEQAIGKTTQAEVGMIGSHRFPMYRSIDKKIDIDYLIAYLLTKRGTGILEDASPGGAGRNRTLGQDLFLKSKIVLPPYEEQVKIVEILSAQDKVIALMEKEADQLRRLKQHYLYKMFPKRGENVPEIRFPGFTGAWEQRKFSEFAQRESTFRSSSFAYPSVEYEDVVAEEGRLNKDVRKKEAQKTGIAFDGTQVLYGKLRPYLHNWLSPDFAGVAVGDWWVLRPVGMDKEFLYRLIQTQQFDEVANQSSGSKMPRADWNLVSNTEFIIPSSLDEQKQIAETFDSIDALITLHQHKCDEEKQKKKALMQLLLTGIARIQE